ncbi:hypothetical protein TanjilG_12875 [Lupinus angustifolius]|uniref:Uncharacterized protein n=1 Tax=Lupinus angustifolius TaxID=3871 RepID=A0A394DFK6_LUPAN|nr:PREDICTED: uncharacterized protein LOC109340694 [Lupinus angustifolius]OIW21828.1 hypothetical protein TanjilG_12875 [Lupinus angustifolius]
MGNLGRPFTKETYNVVGRVKLNGRCKKHPKHNQSPGVCSLCLKENLNHLSTSKSHRTKTSSINVCSSSSSSLSSYYSSCSTSSCASPMHCFHFTTEGKSTSNARFVSFFLLSGKHGITKSKSMDFVPRRNDREGEGDVLHHAHKNMNAKKSGFWFELLRLKSKRAEEKDTKLVRFMSIRETVTVAS